MSPRLSCFRVHCAEFFFIVPFPIGKGFQCRELEPIRFCVACARGEVVELAKPVDGRRGILPSST